MKIVLLHNHYNEKHLEKVIEEMKEIGAPSIRVYDLGFDDLYQAIEGCHRLRACEVLGVSPKIDIISKDEEIGNLENIDAECLNPSDKVEILGDWENYHIEV